MNCIHTKIELDLLYLTRKTTYISASALPPTCSFMLLVRLGIFSVTGISSGFKVCCCSSCKNS